MSTVAKGIGLAIVVALAGAALYVFSMIAMLAYAVVVEGGF